MAASAGSQHSLFLNDRGEVFAAGCNQKYQLGVQDVINSSASPVKVPIKHRVVKVEAKSSSAAVTANGELLLWGVGVFGSFKMPQKVISITNPVQQVCLGGSTLGAAIDVKGLLWTWGSNVSGELGVGDNEPKVHPYPVTALKKKQVNTISCGSQFIVALGSNLKKELPGLKLNLRKLSQPRKHRRNHNEDVLSQASGGQTSVFGQQKHSSHSLDRTKTVQVSITRSNKKSHKHHHRSFHRLLKRENFNSYSKSQSSMIYPGIMIGNGALNSQFKASPRDENSGERSIVV